jgi:hypothetical protein
LLRIVIPRFISNLCCDFLHAGQIKPKGYLK